MPSVTVNGRRLHYLDEGTGDDAVVFVHDVPLHAQMWQPQVSALAADFRVVRPGLAGFGESETPGDSVDAYSIEGWADDVIGIVGALGLEQIALVGASTGADVALSVMRRARQIVSALAVVSPRPANG